MYIHTYIHYVKLFSLLLSLPRIACRLLTPACRHSFKIRGLRFQRQALDPTRRILPVLYLRYPVLYL